MLLDIVDRNCEDALQMLRSRTEVILADHLEGYPNIIAMVQAANRQSLAEAIMPILESLDGITEGLRLLVTRDNGISLDLLTSSDSAYSPNVLALIPFSFTYASMLSTISIVGSNLCRLHGCQIRVECPLSVLNALLITAV